MIIKIGILALLALYAVFAFVVLNQIRVMNRLVSFTAASFIIFLLGAIHLLAALALFIVALGIL